MSSSVNRSVPVIIRAEANIRKLEPTGEVFHGERNDWWATRQGQWIAWDKQYRCYVVTRTPK